MAIDKIDGKRARERKETNTWIALPHSVILTRTKTMIVYVAVVLVAININLEHLRHKQFAQLIACHITLSVQVYVTQCKMHFFLLASRLHHQFCSHD